MVWLSAPRWKYRPNGEGKFVQGAVSFTPAGVVLHADH